MGARTLYYLPRVTGNGILKAGIWLSVSQIKNTATLRAQDILHLCLPNVVTLDVLVAVSKGMWVLKVWSRKITYGTS